jgi:hypothetical protein
MPIRPLDLKGEYVEVYEEESTSPDHRKTIKFVFLVLLVVIGVVFASNWTRMGEETGRYEATRYEATKNPEPTRGYTFFNTKEEYFMSWDQTVDELKLESQKLVGESIAFAGSKVNEVGAQVLGEATKIAQDTASKSADTVTNVVYEYTVGAVILNLIEKLPVGVREKVIETICQKEGCQEATPSAQIQ